MKVYIGPYKNWWGPYQIVRVLRYVGVSEDTCDNIADWICDHIPGIVRFCEWIDSFKQRTIKVRIDRYDLWNLDHTLSHIILPALIMLKDDKQGYPLTDEEDGPDHLKGEDDDFNEKRWDWILDEMIWTFTAINDDDFDDQFYSGTPSGRTVCINPEAPDNEKLYEYVKNDDDTFKFDRENYDKVQARIENGLRLFGKYYRNLWN